jgi:ATP-dependent DNA ligase
VRLFTRRGYDWTDRYPAIAGAAAKLRARSFTLDGEAVICGADGVSRRCLQYCAQCGSQIGRNTAPA